MSWFSIGNLGKAIWGAVTRPFTPPPPRPAPAAPVMRMDERSIRSGGVERLRQAALIDPRVPPVEGPNLVHNNAGSLIGNNAGGLVSNNVATFGKPWWQIW